MTGHQKQSPATSAILIVAVIVLLLLGTEVFTRYLLRTTALAVTPVDIQSPLTLCAKLDALRRFDGRRVVVLGDSLAFGRVLKDFGSADWRDEELASAIAAGIGRDNSSPTIVMNLGLNGGLPADQVRILELLKEVDIDLIVTTISIRSFASDFSLPENANSRAWLSSSSALSIQSCEDVPSGDTLFERTILRFLSSASELYRSRDLIQRAILDGTPRETAERAQKRLNAILSGSSPGSERVPSVDPQVLLLAKGRFSRISFDKPHSQVEALQQFIERTQKVAQRTIIVYGRENPRMLLSLLPRSTYEIHRTKLKAMISASCRLGYLENVNIPSNLYLDYVHVNAAGYRRMADDILALWTQMRQDRTC